MRSMPFVSNTEDDLHCLQAAYLMIVKYYKSDFVIDWDLWSQLTGYEEGKGTWASSGLLWFHDNGFSVKHISLFDYDDFSKNGAEYLLREFGEEVGEWQKKHSNIPKEIEFATALLNKGLVEKREPLLSDIIKYLNDGYLLRCMVNSMKLNGKKGYFGHAIVVSDHDSKGIIIQDPGLPPQPNRHVSFDVFEESWADPNSQAKELDVIKLL
jgi:hypothetical protein